MPRAQNNNNNPVSSRSHSPQTPLSLRVHSSFRNILKNGRLRLPSSAGPSGAHGCAGPGYRPLGSQVSRIHTSELSPSKAPDVNASFFSS